MTGVDPLLTNSKEFPICVSGLLVAAHAVLIDVRAELFGINSVALLSISRPALLIRGVSSGTSIRLLAYHIVAEESLAKELKELISDGTPLALYLSFLKSRYLANTSTEMFRM